MAAATPAVLGGGAGTPPSFLAAEVAGAARLAANSLRILDTSEGPSDWARALLAADGYVEERQSGTVAAAALWVAPDNSGSRNYLRIAGLEGVLCAKVVPKGLGRPAALQLKLHCDPVLRSQPIERTVDCETEIETPFTVGVPLVGKAGLWLVVSARGNEREPEALRCRVELAPRVKLAFLSAVKLPAAVVLLEREFGPRQAVEAAAAAAQGAAAAAATGARGSAIGSADGDRPGALAVGSASGASAGGSALPGTATPGERAKALLGGQVQAARAGLASFAAAAGLSRGGKA